MNDDGSTSQFSYTTLLLFFQSVSGAALALAAHTVIRMFNPYFGSIVVDGQPTTRSELTTHLISRPGFTACATFYLLAMAFSNEALRYVSYPFQCTSVTEGVYDARPSLPSSCSRKSCVFVSPRPVC